MPYRPLERKQQIAEYLPAIPLSWGPTVAASINRIIAHRHETRKRPLFTCGRNRRCRPLPSTQRPSRSPEISALPRREYGDPDEVAGAELGLVVGRSSPADRRRKRRNRGSEKFGAVLPPKWVVGAAFRHSPIVIMIAFELRPSS